jgi:hypothetical protein
MYMMNRPTRVALLAAFLAVACLVSACGGSSTPAPAQATQASVPTATAPAVAETPATPTPQPTAPAPTATAVPPTETAPTLVPDAAPTTAAQFQIEGPPEFVAWTEEALQLLRTEAPEWYEQVAASIRTFRSVPAGSGMDVFDKVYLVGEVTAYAPGFPPASQLIWYAGTIVHDSCHSERYDDGLVYLGKEGETACLMDQKAALLLIDTDTYFSDYVQSLIDGAADPANAYWTNANRHW